jgi:serine/threonine protein kinase
MIEPGKVLQQRYRIEKQIGQGGMGAVYVATDERFGSRVAIKETLFMDDNYRKAIEREARLLNSLKHSALPRVSDHFLEENGQFLVMEYISGEDLGHVMEDNNHPFPVDQVLTWADQLLDALDFLHNQVNPVIHRDIKPQNLKVTPKGQIILLDFGLAKGNPTDAGHQTAAKSIFGYSRNYASLEQIQGTGTDPRSDLYSLAATLYHLLTDRPPDDALTRAMAVLSHQPDPLIPANRIVPEIPGGVAGVLQKALALNAGQRPATAAEMREMLRDPDPYAETVLTPVTAASMLPTEIHSAHTKIMPGATIHEGGRQTDIKTEVLPAYLSQVTDVKHLVKNQTAAPRSRRLRFVAVGLTAIVLACTAIGGVYLYNPALFDHDLEQAPAAQVPPVEDVVVPSTNSNLGNNATAELAPSPNTSETGSATVQSVTSPDKSRESAKTNKPSTSKESQPPSIGGVIVQDGTVYVGNTRISNGRVETPNGVIDPNFNPRPGVNVPAMPPPDLRNLTPEQRRRVIRAMRRNGIIVPKPSPQ